MAKGKANLWSDDSVQFPRLLAEINACGLSEDQYAAIAESMALTIEQVDELLDRAEAAWDKHLRSVGLR